MFKKILFSISGLLLIMVVALHLPKAIQSQATYINHTNSVYIATNDDLMITFKMFEEKGITVVANANRIDTTKLSAIYIHPDVMDELPTETLKEWYDQNILITVINTPISTVADALGQKFDWSDLPEEYHAKDSKHTTIVALQSNVNLGKGTDGFWGYYDFFSSEYVNYIFGIVENRLIDQAQDKETSHNSSNQNMGVSCATSPTIDLKAGAWTTSIGTTMQGIHWSTSEPDYVNGGTKHLTYASTQHNNGNNNSHYIRAQTEIWNNCGYVHKITQNQLGQYNAKAVCNVNAQVNATCNAPYWGTSYHSIRPMITSPWTVGSPPNITVK